MPETGDTTTQDVLDLIDSAVHDWEVGPDAMRSVPAEQRDTATPPTLVTLPPHIQAYRPAGAALASMRSLAHGGIVVSHVSPGPRMTPFIDGQALRQGDVDRAGIDRLLAAFQEAAAGLAQVAAEARRVLAPLGRAIAEAQRANTGHASAQPGPDGETARERALRLRKTRHTGPVRDPHARRGRG